MKHILVRGFFLAVLILLVLWHSNEPLPYWYFAVVLIIWFLINMIGSSLIEWNWHLKAYSSNPNEKSNKLALTFDDGPNENTIRILEILQKNQIKAAFFCIGRNVQEFPEIAKKIVDEGHIIANHSFNHSNSFDFYPTEKVVSELRQTDKIILETTGRKVKFFRPPFGVTNPSIKRSMLITKHKVIGWNIRSMDGITKNTKLILNRILRRISPGSIILLHDNRDGTALVLEQLLQTLAEKKYEVVSLEQLLNLKAYEN